MEKWVEREGSGAALGGAEGMRGTAMIFIVVAITSCLAFSVLTLDVGMILMTKVQLQNAADAAALAGASALVDGNNQVEARRRAIAIAASNLAWEDGLEPVVINDADITFPTATRCRVVTHRTRATGDPLRTFFIGVLDPESDRRAEVSAIAEAEYYEVCGSRCLKPWSIPDRWDDLDRDGMYDYAEPFNDLNRNGRCDSGEPYQDQNGNGRWDPNEPYDAESTGYLRDRDLGRRMTLKVGSSQDAIVPGFFYPVDLPPLGSSERALQTGGDAYRDHIANCADYQVRVGDWLRIKPGNMQGPTWHGTEALINRDPGAYWDVGSQSVLGSAFGTSPRIVKVALFDPRFTPRSGRNEVLVAKLGAFFIEGVRSNGDVTGVFVETLTPQGEPCEGNEPSFVTRIHLVR